MDGNGRHLSEQTRNQLLRSVDWRFLTACPRPRMTALAAEERLRQAAALVSDHLITLSAASADECDLAMIDRPDVTTLARAWSALRPGGWCYTVWPYLHTNPSHIERMLSETGFVEVVCHVTWPRQGPLGISSRAAQPQLWLPLDAPGLLAAIPHLFPPPPRRLSRLLRRLKGRHWIRRQQLRWTRPVHALARKPVSETTNQSDNDNGPRQVDSGAWIARMHAEWESWGLGPTPTQLSWALLTRGRRTISKVVGLVFADGGSQPTIAVKFPRVDEAIPGLRHESLVLQQLHVQRPELGGIPRVIFCEEDHGVFVVGEQAVPGVIALGELHRGSYGHVALLVTDWLIDLAGDAQPVRREVCWDRLVEPALVDFASAFGAVLEPEMMRQADDVLSALGPLPLVCEQRDCSPWNVLLLPNGGIGLLDWESAELEGLPGLDLMYFLTYAAAQVMPGTRGVAPDLLASYRMVRNPATPVGKIATACLDRYSQALRLDVQQLQPLWLALWMFHARSAHQRTLRGTTGEPGPPPRGGNLFVNLWKEELRLVCSTVACGGCSSSPRQST